MSSIDGYPPNGTLKEWIIAEPESQVTLGILQQAKDLSIPALWIQPGAEDATVIEYIKDPENGLEDAHPWQL